jgi:hypothetical protein
MAERNDQTAELTNFLQRRSQQRHASPSAVCVCGTESPEISVYHNTARRITYEAQAAIDTNQYPATEAKEAIEGK